MNVFWPIVNIIAAFVMAYAGAHQVVDIEWKFGGKNWTVVSYSCSCFKCIVETYSVVFSCLLPLAGL